MLYKQSIFLFALFILAVSCTHTFHTDQRIEALDGFATAYFNYDFQTAAKFCTPESEKWLRYEASQMKESDVERLVAKEHGISYIVNSVEKQSDSLSVATLEVYDYYMNTAVDSVGQEESKVIFVIPMCYQNKQWLVTLKSPLRPRRVS